MKDQELIPNLFRNEYSKIVAVLCKTFGFSNIEWAEDLVSETFMVAMETWQHKGNPDNPRAWLYQVAKNKAKDYFKRNKIFNEKIEPELRKNGNNVEDLEIDLSDHNIKDSQLQMLFTVCNPIISLDAQVAMALRILCGFGIDEIAQAFLTNKAAINKRLLRSKATFRKNNIDLSFPKKDQLDDRLKGVMSTIYLLFNEGYFSCSTDQKIKKDLCYEAMRLLNLLINNDETNKPECNALMALFCFHASRFDARVNEHGDSVLYENQNRDLWNDELIHKGEQFLNHAVKNSGASKYHLEAVIAYWHTRKKESPEKWDNILQVYNQLLQVEYSPMAALNRTYALSKVHGNKSPV